MFREFLGDFGGVRLALGIEPLGNPIERIETSTNQDSEFEAVPSACIVCLRMAHWSKFEAGID